MLRILYDIILIQVSNEWKRCITDEIKMPIPNIHTFESDGNFKEKIVFEWEDPYIEELLEIEEEGTIPEIEQVEKEKVEKKKEE